MTITIKFPKYTNTCPVCGDMTHTRAISARKIYASGCHYAVKHKPNEMICERCFSMWNLKTGKIIRKNQHILIPITNYK